MRLLSKTPGFTAVVLLTIALGVGANTAVFAVVHAALMRALPYPDADRIVRPTDQAPGLFLDWQREATSFSAMCALSDAAIDVTGFDKPERITGAIVTAGFFDVVRRSSGARPAVDTRRRLQRRTRRGDLRTATGTADMAPIPHVAWHHDDPERSAVHDRRHHASRGSASRKRPRHGFPHVTSCRSIRCVPRPMRRRCGARITSVSMRA